MPLSTLKPYSRPSLEIYGNIGDITHSVGMTSASPDGAVHGMTKTA